MDAALRSCDGDMTRANDFLNCGVYEYYYRVMSRKNYVEWKIEQSKTK